MTLPENEQAVPSWDIAIIGMNGRFPGAPDLDTFWRNLRDGVDSISTFSDDELLAAGVTPAEFNHPNYVRAAPVLDDIELFDASFFGYAPLEASAMDPQQRLMLEAVWHALEAAGYDPLTFPDPIALFAGARLSAYMLNAYTDPLLAQPQNQLLVLLGNDSASLSTRISYKLNLRGPSSAVQSGCSTALVALHLACQSLLLGECRMAVAAGVTINVPHRVGYLYEPGSMLSPDGHCRAFDAQAQGTVFGSGLGVVVLKRLADALADRDTIHAVVKGSAVNNDGSAKASFTAPSVEGQRAVIIDALASAGVEASSISYLEAHATATALGDPIELRALTQAFRAQTRASEFCRIGTVKSNLGHLDAAAGMAGLLKTVLALRNEQLPPSLHFHTPNPEIDFARSPFVVNTELSAWPRGATPRRAGVSAFGFGGTNAHVIVEEAPLAEPSGVAREWQLLVLSARTPTALEAATRQLAAQLRATDELKLADVAYTLQVGRHGFARRRMWLLRTDEALATVADRLEAADGGVTNAEEHGERPIVFMFPGQGAQYDGMGQELYASEPTFRAVVDQCAALLQPHLGLDIREIIYPAEGAGIRDQGAESERDADWQTRPRTGGSRTAATTDPRALALDQTQYTQPALFVVEYALAQLWLSWGVTPSALIGHSLGEYVAATLAGVFSLDDALALVALRGRLMASLPAGAMLSVPLSEAELRPLLDDALDIAATNAPALTVVAGPLAAIDALEERLADTLTARGLETRRLSSTLAFHSRSMQPLIAPFAAAVARMHLQPPTLPVISNVTGERLTAAQATDPAYWAEQLRAPVQFAAGLRALDPSGEPLLLEVGPGRTLSTFARQTLPALPRLQSLRPPREALSEQAALLTTLGQLWLAGGLVDWAGVSAHERRQRLPLPGYPFERQRYWVEPGSHALSAPGTASTTPYALAKQADLADWFYQVVWQSTLPPAPLAPAALAAAPTSWLLFADDAGLADALTQQLQQAGHTVTTVRVGEQFLAHDTHCYSVRPTQTADYSALLTALREAERFPTSILHLWTLRPDDQTVCDDALFAQMQTLGVSSLLALAQALGLASLTAPLDLAVITNQLYAVSGTELLCPEKATLLGPCRVIPREYLAITCRCLDLVIPQRDAALVSRLAAQVLADLHEPARDASTISAYRGSRRWVQSVAPLALAPAEQGRSRLRDGGVYLITGGLGGIGLALAEHLARTRQAKLVLVGRRAFPARADWPTWLTDHADDDPTSLMITQLLALETHGAEVLLQQADVTDVTAMRAVVATTLATFGALHGVIHAAGIAGGGLIQLKTPEMVERVLAPKTRGLLALTEACRELPLELLVLCSSLTALVGEFGQADYAAANAFLDAFAQAHSAQTGCWSVAINWDTWQEVGMAVSTVVPPELQQVHSQIMQGGLRPAEGLAVFERILAHGSAPQVLVSTKELPTRIASIHALTRSLLAEAQAQAQARAQHAGHARPSLATAYVAPRNAFEEHVATVWQQVLGLEQVGIHDSFFDLGGHSLLITQLLNKLHQLYHVEISIQGLFDHPTVAGMAEVIAEAYAQQQAQQTQPIAEQLRGATAAEQQSLLEGYWRTKLSGVLRIAPSDIPADGRLEAYDLVAVVAELQWIFQQELGLQIYPHELPALDTLGALSRFTRRELTRRAQTQQPLRTGAPSRYTAFEAQDQLARRLNSTALARPAQPNPPIGLLHSGPRSGSTLFRVMLAGHPALFAPPELGILWYDTLRDWQRSLVDPDYGHGFFWAGQGMQWTFMELLGRDAEATKAYLDEQAARGVPIAAVYAELQALAAPRLLIDKSPSYTMSLATLQRAEVLFAGAKHLQLVRHPYAMIESFVRIRLDKLFGPVIYGDAEVDPYVVAEKVWVTSNRNLLTFLEQVPAERQLLVRYEELVREPERVMRGVCAFLSVPYDAAVLTPYDNQRARMISGIGDPNILTHTAVEAQLGEKWRTVQLPWRLGEQARALAAQLGYELPVEDAAPSNGTSPELRYWKATNGSAPEPDRPAAADVPPPEHQIPRRQPTDAPLLSFAQQRFWLLQQLQPDSPAYNMRTVVRLVGRLDVAILARSLNAIMRRHEVLRTSFASADGQPNIAPFSPIQLPVLALHSLPPAERDAQLQRLTLAETERPFDLARGPLLRARLLRLATDEHVLLLTMHHIISDGWSQGVQLRELMALYGAFTQGAPSPLPELPIQYADYALWQRQVLQRSRLSKQLAYWKEQLGWTAHILDLPTDRPRPAVATYRGAWEYYTMPTALLEQLKGLSRRAGVTLFMTLLAVFSVLLYRYTGQTDVVVGTPVAGRNLSELEGLIGCFINMLALRTNLSGNPSFRELLQRVRNVTLGAYAHQEVPFEQVVEELQLEPDLSRSAIFQVMFNLQNAPMPALKGPELSLLPLEIIGTTSLLDLSLYARELEHGLLIRAEYNTDLFDAATIRRMLGHFHMLLEGAVADPEQPLCALPLLAEEARQLLSPVEDALAELWANMLDREQIDRHDTFFDLGGQPAKAAQLIARLRETFQVNLAVRSLFAAPTVATMAELIVAREARPGQAVQIARMFMRLRRMPAAERQKVLAQKRRSHENSR